MRILFGIAIKIGFFPLEFSKTDENPFFFVFCFGCKTSCFAWLCEFLCKLGGERRERLKTH